MRAGTNHGKEHAMTSFYVWSMRHQGVLVLEGNCISPVFAATNPNGGKRDNPRRIYFREE